MTRIGVIGAGYWGPNLIRNFAEMDEVELVAVADRDADRLAGVLKRYPSVRGESDGAAILADDSIEAVVIVTPAETHHAIAKRALEAGKHVLVEKPLTMKTDEARDLIALADQKKLVLMTGHTFEYNPAVRHLKKIVRSDDFGGIRYIYATRVNLGVFRAGINAMWNLAPHDLSIVFYLLEEEPIAVRALGQSFLKPGIEDVVFLYLEFPSGKIAHVHVSWLDPSKVRRVTVVGGKKMAIYDDLDSEQKLKIYDRGFDSVLFEEGGIRDYQVRLRGGDIHAPKIEGTEPLRVECAHFIECIRDGKTPLSDGRSGLRVVAGLEAAAESLANGGKRVLIP